MEDDSPGLPCASRNRKREVGGLPPPFLMPQNRSSVSEVRLTYLHYLYRNTICQRVFLPGCNSGMSARAASLSLTRVLRSAPGRLLHATFRRQARRSLPSILVLLNSEARNGSRSTRTGETSENTSRSCLGLVDGLLRARAKSIAEASDGQSPAQGFGHDTCRPLDGRHRHGGRSC